MKYTYGDFKVGDPVFCNSYHRGGYAWWEIKALSDEEGFKEKYQYTADTQPDQGFLIDDGFMNGRGTFVRYEALPIQGSLNFEEIEI